MKCCITRRPSWRARASWVFSPRRIGARAKAIAGICHVNPFLPERVELERQALGTRYKEEGPLIWARPGEGREEYRGNIPAMRERAEAIVSEMRRRIEGGRTATRDELLVYEDLALFLLYARHMDALEGIVTKSLQRTGWDGRAPSGRTSRPTFSVTSICPARNSHHVTTPA